MLELTEEVLTQIEQYASIYLKISDMAVILDIPAEKLRSAIADRTTEVSKRYHRGKATSKIKLLHQEMLTPVETSWIWRTTSKTSCHYPVS